MANTGLNTGENKGRIVEAVFACEDELLLHGLRRECRAGGDCAEVGHRCRGCAWSAGAVCADGVGVGAVCWAVRLQVSGLGLERWEASERRGGTARRWTARSRS